MCQGPKKYYIFGLNLKKKRMDPRRHLRAVAAAATDFERYFSGFNQNIFRRSVAIFSETGWIPASALKIQNRTDFLNHLRNPSVSKKKRGIQLKCPSGGVAFSKLFRSFPDAEFSKKNRFRNYS